MSLVLVADDEPAVLEVLSQVVEDLGHEVVKARDGAEALELARERRPQLVVTDHMMPRLSGVELCRRLKRDATLGDVPVILLSAVLPQGAPEAHAFLHKPFEITDFESLVHRSLAHAPRAPAPEPEPPVVALGHWTARALQGALEVAWTQLKRLEADPRLERDALASLGVQLQSLDALGRTLRDAARLMSGELSLHAVEGDLAWHLRDAVSLWRTRAAVSLSAPVEPVSVTFDADRVRQILDVLLANAVRQGQARVELQSSRSRVTVRVRDGGPGLSEETARRLFAPFQFQDGPAGAAGLGFYVAAELARLHGGGLSVESRLGQGSTFSLHLPRGTRAEAQSR
ncbi:response regulator [Myxococcus sp. K15C18031901]|uniref:ATP-binding response regulator n=1 Tax=Myxococcus dinghuensis TaxID=2906761 RepID=UPI0020A70E32|nr:response regulator [Myxococcus dinghuensis]MCP3103456.1 response regulator [Myxococcus dinghuensis]